MEMNKIEVDEDEAGGKKKVLASEVIHQKEDDSLSHSLVVRHQRESICWVRKMNVSGRLVRVLTGIWPVEGHFSSSMARCY